LQAGTTETITWYATGSIGQYVKIDLYQAGKLIRTVQTNAPLADGSYQWLIDSDLQGLGYSVMVSSTACSSAYGTSGNFSISPSEDFDASGMVTSGGAGLSGVTINFSRVSGTGAIPASVSTVGSGGWSQTGFQLGTVYRATPSKTNCSFSPAFLDFSDANNNLNFTIAKTAITSRAKLGSGGVGSYSWRIGKQQAAGSYQIRVTSTTNGSSATNNGFSITK
jgi:hypothetical protein